MDNGLHSLFPVTDRSYFALIKKEIHLEVSRAGFSEHRTGEVDLVVAELVTNLVKHGKGGYLLAKQITDGARIGFELLAVDSGAGMADVQRMMGDGYSTTNTLGHGLGTIRRLSDFIQVYSQKGWGTIVLCRIFRDLAPAPPAKPLFDVQSLVCPKPGETACGDKFYFKLTGHVLRIFLGDGLGHGPEAARAVGAAVEAMRICPDESPVDILRFMHAQVRKTRGLVGTVAVANLKDRTLRVCGVGNIATRIGLNLNFKNYIAYNGIIGHNISGSMKDQATDLEKGQTILLCSDGLKTRWEITRYPSILKYDLSVLLGALFKDYGRLTDDTSLAAVKILI